MGSSEGPCISCNRLDKCSDATGEMLENEEGCSLYARVHTGVHRARITILGEFGPWPLLKDPKKQIGKTKTMTATRTRRTPRSKAARLRRVANAAGITNSATLAQLSPEAITVEIGNHLGQDLTEMSIEDIEALVETETSRPEEGGATTSATEEATVVPPTRRRRSSRRKKATPTATPTEDTDTTETATEEGTPTPQRRVSPRSRRRGRRSATPSTTSTATEAGSGELKEMVLALGTTVCDDIAPKVAALTEKTEEQSADVEALNKKLDRVLAGQAALDKKLDRVLASVEIQETVLLHAENVELVAQGEYPVASLRDIDWSVSTEGNG